MASEPVLDDGYESSAERIQVVGQGVMFMQNSSQKLVVKNGNGKIDNTSELFGTKTTDGFVILKTLDSNSDGVINNSDANFSNLRIWQDVNENGRTDPGELFTLAQKDVVSEVMKCAE